MADIQAALEFTVELTKLHNIDLFQRGYYHVRCSVKGGPKTTLKSEATIVKPNGGSNSLSAYTCKNVGVSRTFPILFKREEVELHNVMLFKVYLLLDSHRIEESLHEACIQLSIDLHFSGSEEPPGSPESMEVISSRLLNLNISGTDGLHSHVPLLFDYFHLSAVSLTVHGSLLGLHQPTFSVPRPVKSGWLHKISGSGSPTKQPPIPSLEGVLFGPPGKIQLSSSSSEKHMAQVERNANAYQIYHSMCAVLLQTRCALCRTFNQLGKNLPQDQQFTLESPDYEERLQMMCESFQRLNDQEEIMESVNTRLSQLSGELCLIWTQFIEVIVKNSYVSNHLRAKYHRARVQRFSEGFFTIDNPKQSAAAFHEISCQGYSYIGQAIRNSLYYTSLPRLPLECTETDGDPETIPIIFEDRYLESMNSEEVLNLSIDEIEQSIRSLPKVTIPKEHPSGDHHKPSSPREKTPSQRLTSMDHLKDKKHSKHKSKSKHNTRSSKTDKSHTAERDYGRYEITNLQPSISELLAASEYPSATSQRKVKSYSSLPSLSRTLSLNNPAKESTGDSTQGCRREGYVKTRALSTPEYAYSSLISQPVQGPYFRNQDEFVEGSESSGIVGSTNILGRSSFDETSGDVYANGYEESDEDPEGAAARMNQDPDLKRQEDFPVKTAQIDLSFINTIAEPNSTDLTANDSVLDDSANIHLCVAVNEEPICLENSQLRFLDTDSGMESDAASSRKNSDTPQIPPSGQTLPSTRPLSYEDAQPDIILETKAISVLDKVGECQASAPDSQPAQLQLSPSQVSSGSTSTVTPISSAIFHPSVGSTSPSGISATFSSSANGSPDDPRQAHRLCDCNSVHLVPSKVNTCIGCFPFMHHCNSSTSSSSNGCSEACVVKPALTHQPTPTTAVSDATALGQSHSTVKRLHPRMQDCLVRTLSEVSQASFNDAKEDFKRKLRFTGKLYSDIPLKASTRPYFSMPEPPMEPEEEQLGLEVHLVVCVHGLDGNRADLRLLKTYLELGLPGERFDFLMSESNQGDTFADFGTMTDRLVKEIIMYIEIFRIRPKKLSFIGHSLGTIIIRSALARPQLQPYISKMFTFLSLSGPHLGQLYNTSTIVNTGMWLMQKWKKSSSLLQLAFRDHTDMRQTFLYKLSQSAGLSYFKNVVLVGSLQDRYVPIHSARIEMCRQAVKDKSLLGNVYSEMINNLLQPVIHNHCSTLVRYDVNHTLIASANTLIGRAAHIAFLDSELFIEKFMMVSGLTYFK